MGGHHASITQCAINLYWLATEALSEAEKTSNVGHLFLQLTMPIGSSSDTGDLQTTGVSWDFIIALLLTNYFSFCSLLTSLSICEYKYY